MSDDPLDGDAVEVLLERAVSALGGSTRTGQVAMARAVAASLAGEEHLMVQAGTGTGKSLAYLVPLAAHAVATGEPVVVSTATLALQRQVAERDVPLLSEALAPALGRALRVEVVKGRSHYVCVNKLAGGMEDEEGPALFDAPDALGGVAEPAAARTAGSASALGRQVKRVRSWAASTPTGDRDDLVPGVSERAWRQVSVTARECLGAARCPVAEQCHVEIGRARAKTADVVVTNHALLAVDALEGRAILPEHDAVVLDEAHEMVGRATSSASAVLAGVAVGAAAAAATRHGVDVDALERAGDDLVAALEEAPTGRSPRGLPVDLVSAVAAVRDAARAGLSSLERSEAPPAPVRAGLSDVFAVAERLLAASESGGDVVWVERAERAAAPALHVAPLSVADVLRERLFATRTVVMTSATLAPAGGFAATAASVGVGLLADGTPPQRESDPTLARALDVGSPFDYPRQGILYVAAHLPPPGREGMAGATADELVDLVRAAGGRTLGLFSSRRAAEAAAEVARERLDVKVLCQGDDTLPALVREFVADEETCLFGTLSLWQGVDAPGPTCQLVVIDRIPFPRPDEPLSAARTEAVARAGGNGFMGVSAAHAALLLAQGAGRLIRSGTDRGVVAVLDPRLSTARYGSFLRAAMPPLWPTTDPAVARSALQRLDAAASAEGQGPS